MLRQLQSYFPVQLFLRENAPCQGGNDQENNHPCRCCRLEGIFLNIIRQGRAFLKNSIGIDNRLHFILGQCLYHLVQDTEKLRAGRLNHPDTGTAVNGYLRNQLQALEFRLVKVILGHISVHIAVIRLTAVYRPDNILP